MAEIIKKQQLSNGNIRILVDFNGTERAYIASSIEGLKNAIRSDIERYQAASTDYTKISLGEFDVSKITSTPTQAEIDRQTYFEVLNKLRQMQELVDIGVFTGSETQITTLKTKVKNEFKTEYLS